MRARERERERDRARERESEREQGRGGGGRWRERERHAGGHVLTVEGTYESMTNVHRLLMCVFWPHGMYVYTCYPFVLESNKYTLVFLCVCCTGVFIRMCVRMYMRVYECMCVLVISLYS